MENDLKMHLSVNINMKLKFYLFFIILFLFGCRTRRELVMPFVNMGYSADRLFPVSESNPDFSFRAWVSLSTNIDRVFSISSDKEWGTEGKLLEIIRRMPHNKNDDRTSFRETNIIPRSGFDEFVLKADSLDLVNMKGQDEKEFQITLHEPIALYVIEIKRHGKTNHFQFRAHLVNDTKIEEKYQKVVDLILKELPFRFYMMDK